MKLDNATRDYITKAIHNPFISISDMFYPMGELTIPEVGLPLLGHPENHRLMTRHDQIDDAAYQEFKHES